MAYTPILRNKLIRSLLLAAPLLTGVSTASFASENWFEIELVIFERSGEQNREQWSTDAPNVDTNGSVELQLEQLMPSYPWCPSLDQVEIAQIIEQQLTMPQLGTPELDMPELDTQAQQQDDLPQSALEESALAQAAQQQPEIETVIKCVLAPLPAVFPDVATQSLLQQVTLNETDLAPQRDGLESQLEPEQELLDQQQITPEQLLQLPEFFSYSQQQYQVVLPSEILTTVPIAVFADQLDTELLQPHLLDQATLQLGDLVKKLRWQKNLSPKLHIGWRQQVHSRHLAKPVHLFGGENLADRFNSDGSQRTAAEPTELTELKDMAAQVADLLTIDDQPSEVIAPIWQINGLFKVYLNKYLFIETNFNKKISTLIEQDNQLMTDLSLNAATNPEQLPVELLPVEQSISLIKAEITDVEGESEAVMIPWLVNHPLQQHRRVKSKQLHYFDHPDYGIVVQIRRFSLEVPEKQ
ncbi:MAG: hypothetical protein HRU22_05675 [Gammaproteobacteria bacterium]|nr:hypothetical protein [Gammaproteobacteria bacterium]